MFWMDSYRTMKQGGAYDDCLCLWRVGDFYEALDEDARRLATAADVVLTTFNGNTPVAGFPVAQADRYLDRLTARGFKVAVFDPEPRLVEQGERRAAASAAPAVPIVQQLSLFG